MSQLTFEQLAAEMQGKSLTYGWDACVSYDQRAANKLLMELYTERFNTAEGNIEPASMVASWGDGSYREHIHDLRLLAPKLSFESSDPSLPARARLTMDMIGGMIVSTKKYSGGAAFVSKMMKVLPIGGPQLWMDQPVTKGVVTGPGKVEIDLKNADTFRANFVFGDLAQEDVGKRFKEYFEKEVPADKKIFPLGSLAGDLNGVLTPKNFEIRTMKADPNAVLGDESYSRGAVTLFITLKDGEDSSFFPNANSTFPIPADGDGTEFTGSVLIASKVVFEKLIKSAVEQSVGEGLSLKLVQPGNDVAASLEATAGGGNKKFRTPDYGYLGNTGTPHVTYTRIDEFPYRFKVDGGAGNVFKVGSVKGALNVTWNSVIGGKHITPGFLDNYQYDYSCRYDLGLEYTALIDSEGEIELGNKKTVLDTKNCQFAHPGVLWNQNGESATRGTIAFQADSIVRDVLNRIHIPGIKTWLLRNILFPGHNALQLSDAVLPGDLLACGKIDPLRTTTALSPSNSTIEAGSKLQFTLMPKPDNVLWSVKDVDGNLAEPGVISPTGEYTAPTADKLPDGFVTVIVTAQGTLDGKPVKSSALVSVLHSAIVVNPIYDSCDQGDTKVLSAEAMGDEVLEWKIVTPQWGSTLTPVEGDPTKRTYKAGGSEDLAVPFSVDKIEIKKTVNGVVTSAFIQVLIHNLPIGTPLLMTEESDPSTGAIQFEVRGKNGPIDPGLLVWKLLSGEGTFNDKTGEYTEPKSPAPGSFIVVSATLEGPISDIHAVAAVPLPLSKYADLIETVNLTLSKG